MGFSALCLCLLVFPLTVGAQVVQFDAGGLKYQTLTRNGLTIMLAQLPAHVREYSIMQVTVSNGSTATWKVNPEDFLYRRNDGYQMAAVPARAVVSELMEKASRIDVIRLVTAYEHSIFGNTQYKATNGFEQRRRSAFAETSSRIKAAAAASAIAFVATKLPPGESTDGAVFYANDGKPLDNGVIFIKAANSMFEFPVLPSN